MNHTIKNRCLTVQISEHGAELQSILGLDGTEYLWQGDPVFWEDRAPVLFPYIGRMIDRKYEYAGREYPMEIHGMAPYADFQVIHANESRITLRLNNDCETLKQYPFHFTFDVEYALTENRLEVTYTVTNHDSKQMLFAVGGHPGFNVPLVEGECFEDYQLRFPEASDPRRIVFTPDCYVDDHTLPCPLKDGKTIPLSHRIFDDEAIVLDGAPKTVSIESLKSGRSVTVYYPQMRYIGFWHEVKTDAPYVCIEPWSSLPSPKGEKTVLTQQADLISLAPGKSYTNRWGMIFA